MDKIKAAVIGLGNIGLMYDYEAQRPHPSTHVFAYQNSPAYTLVCGIDRNEDRKEYFAKIAPKAAFCDSIDHAISMCVLNDVDVVSICTPPFTHLAILTQLLEKDIGKLIFCEKPIISNINETGRLKQITKEYKDVIIVPNISRRWNFGLRKVTETILGGEYGKLEKINIRYTRGIYNTGSHLFDLLQMWTGKKIVRVRTLSETHTSAFPEKSYSFYFEQDYGVKGFAEAIDDTCYYLFEIDLYLSNGKIEMRNSGDDMVYYKRENHHLFEGFMELKEKRRETHLLSDPCIQNAVDNMEDVIRGRGESYCTMEDAIYPLYVAAAIEKSYKTKKIEEVRS